MYALLVCCVMLFPLILHITRTALDKGRREKRGVDPETFFFTSQQVMRWWVGSLLIGTQLSAITEHSYILWWFPQWDSGAHKGSLRYFFVPY